MKRISLILSVAIVIASTVLSVRFISHSLANQRDKADRSVLNHIRYGMFNVDEWKDQLSAILTGEIQTLNFNKKTRRALKKRLEGLLSTLIDKVYEQIKKGNSKTAGGRFKQSFINMFVDLKEVKEGIPGYADALIKELTRAKTKKQVKVVLNNQLERYFEETFSEKDTSQIDAIIERTGSEDIEGARAKLDRDISTRRHLIRNEAVFLALLTITLFSWTARSGRTVQPDRYILLILSLFILLVAGVATPMIDMEAKISRMGFMLLGHPIHFENQVLYYQSKSIMDVFWILITDHDFLMKLVGVLLVTFSVIFPLLKLASLLTYHFDYRGLRKHPAIEFFALKSAKWSMADVMVLAIFMAYIGFNGIITSQFKQLSAASRSLELMTTNGTSLQPGYYLFLTFILLGMIFSKTLTEGPREKGAEQEGCTMQDADRSVEREEGCGKTEEKNDA
jgi:Paraquat-inducible protein A